MALKEYSIGDTFSMVYNGYFSMSLLYKLVRSWILENGYGPDKWMEELYLQREAPIGTEHWIFWRTSKKINSFITYKINVDFHTLGMNKSEMVNEGKKVKTDKGEVEVFFTPILTVDPDEKWKNAWWFKYPAVQQWWLKRFYRIEIDKHEELVIKDAYRLQGIIKQYLDLKGFLREYAGEPFHPIKGLE